MKTNKIAAETNLDDDKYALCVILSINVHELCQLVNIKPLQSIHSLFSLINKVTSLILINNDEICQCPPIKSFMCSAINNLTFLSCSMISTINNIIKLHHSNSSEVLKSTWILDKPSSSGPTIRENLFSATGLWILHLFAEITIITEISDNLWSC